MQAMKIMWQSADSHVFRQLNFSNILREKLQRLIIAYLFTHCLSFYFVTQVWRQLPSKFDVTEIPLQLQDSRGLGVFAGQTRPKTDFFCTKLIWGMLLPIIWFRIFACGFLVTIIFGTVSVWPRFLRNESWCWFDFHRRVITDDRLFKYV